MLPPRPAGAQLLCEMPIVPPIVAGILTILQQADIDAMLGPPGALLPTLLTNQVASVTQTIAGGDGGLNVVDALGLTTYKPPNPCVDVSINVFSLNIGGNVCLFDVPVIGSWFANSVQMAKEHAYFGGLGYMDITMRSRLDTFWRDLHTGLKAMTAQIYASGMNNARMLASLHDAGNLSATGGMIQDTQIDDKLQYEVSDQSCQFDTMAGSISNTSAVGLAVTTSLVQELNDMSNLSAGSPAADGPAAYRRRKFQFYKDHLCDPNSNGGASACKASVQEKTPPEMASGGLIGKAEAQTTPQGTQPDLANKGVQPPMEPTIDVTNQNSVEAMKQFCENVVNYQPPPSYPEKALDNARVQEQQLIAREYATQMDALSSLCTGVMGDKTPGDTSSAVQQEQQRLGINAPAKSSADALMQTTTARLMDPKFYQDLNNGGGTVAQNEIYLKAYNLMLLGRLYDYQEKISVAYAIQAANRLKSFKDTGPGSRQ